MQVRFQTLKAVALRIWAGWNAVAHVIGNFNARIILTIIYFVVVVPFSLIVRFGGDPLRLRSKTSNWVPRNPTAAPDYHRQS